MISLKKKIYLKLKFSTAQTFQCSPVQYFCVQVSILPGCKVGVILCGGNLDMEALPWHIVKPQ